MNPPINSSVTSRVDWFHRRSKLGLSCGHFVIVHRDVLKVPIEQVAVTECIRCQEGDPPERKIAGPG